MDEQKEIIDNTKIAGEIKQTSRTSLFQRLSTRFGFVARNTKDSKKPTYKIIQKPTEKQLSSKTPKEELDLISKLYNSSSMSSSVQDLFAEWMNDTQSTYANIGERQDRLNALTHLCDNEPLVMAAVELTANEVASLSNNQAAFQVVSENQEWQDATNDLLKNVWKYDAQKIFSLAWDIFLYGEAFEGNEVNSAGIVSIEGLRPNIIVERLEFDPAETANFLAQANAGSNDNSSTGFSVSLTAPTSGSFSNTNLNFNWNKSKKVYQSKDMLLKKYLDNLADTSSNEFFTTHLLGYRMGNDQMIAPWQVSHYRYHADTSEFKPYGQPPLLSALAAYKQLQRSLGLDDLRKMLSLPITQYKVKTGNTTTSRAFDIVNTVKEEFENVGLMSISSGLEGPSLCTNIWTSDDLVTIDRQSESTGSEAGATEEKLFFQNRVATATGIPKAYLDPAAEGFQMSGVALTSLFAPYRHKIEYIRNVICNEVEDKIRLHDAIQKKDTPDFVLTLNVNNPIDTNDFSSKLNLATTVLTTIAALLGVEEAVLPKSVKKDILSKYAGLSMEELDKYLNMLEQEGEDTDGVEIDQEAAEAGFGDFDMGGVGGGDEGPAESAGSDDLEESFYQSKKKQLLEKRYYSLKKEDLLYGLTEALGSFRGLNFYSHFSQDFNSKTNKDAAMLLRKSITNKKNGKSRIQG